MIDKKKLIILLNIGSPESPEICDVRNYLVEFLDNKRVINLPWFIRKPLVRGIISFFRSKSSSRKYKEIWTKEGSPLIINSEKCANKLQNSISDEFIVKHAMTNGKQNLYDVMNESANLNLNEIILVPMYPHYATCTTIDALEKFDKYRKEVFPNLKTRIKKPFYDNKNYIEALSKKFSAFNLRYYDHIVFSYHGLPINQVESTHKINNSCDELDCANHIDNRNPDCYLAQCYATTRLLAKRLELVNVRFSTSFQSRFSRKWISPHTNELLIKLAKSGKKNVLIISPSFVVDCLETLHEIKIEYKELFTKHGGERLDYIECLNDDDAWIFALKRMVM